MTREAKKTSGACNGNGELKRTRDTWNNDDTDHGQGTRQNMTEHDRTRQNKTLGITNLRPNILSSQ